MRASPSDFNADRRIRSALNSEPLPTDECALEFGLLLEAELQAAQEARDDYDTFRGYRTRRGRYRTQYARPGAYRRVS